MCNMYVCVYINIQVINTYVKIDKQKLGIINYNNHI